VDAIGIALHRPVARLLRHEALIFRHTCAWQVPCGCVSFIALSADPLQAGAACIHTKCTEGSSPCGLQQQLVHCMCHGMQLPSVAAVAYLMFVRVVGMAAGMQR
jgi:hypothetical protein